MINWHIEGNRMLANIGQLRNMIIDDMDVGTNCIMYESTSSPFWKGTYPTYEIKPNKFRSIHFSLFFSIGAILPFN